MLPDWKPQELSVDVLMLARSPPAKVRLAVDAASYLGIRSSVGRRAVRDGLAPPSFD